MARKRQKDSHSGRGRRSRIVDHKFEPFDIPKQLIHQLEETPLYDLKENLGELNPDGRGVYVLYHGDDPSPVYVGKTDQAGKVRRRLKEHAKKIAGRENIEVAHIRFRYLVMDNNWLVRAGEEALITHYKPKWQRSGLGSHIPGRGRPGVRGEDRFTKLYPPSKSKTRRKR